MLAVYWPDKSMISRDIGCAKVTSERGKELCQAVSDSMEWTWTGHAIISPGWRVTWDGVGRVYCREKISDADIAVLESMKQGSDWRLQDSADDLRRLVSNRSGKASEDENSIFNPKNPHYILKDGCKGDQ
jgi:hypothetical protein